MKAPNRWLHVLLTLGSFVCVIISVVPAHTQPSSPETPLFQAIKSGRVEEVRDLLSKGAKVNVKDDKGRGPLFFAVESNASDSDKTEIIQLLLKKGARIEAKDNYGRTALTAAITTGDINLVKGFLDQGADPNVRDKEGRTLLMTAIEADNLELVRTLVDKGANLNIKDKVGRTALIRAVLAEKLQFVEALLEKKVDLEAKTQDGLSALMLACGYSRQGVLTSLTFTTFPPSGGGAQTVHQIVTNPTTVGTQDGLPETLPQANLKLTELLLKNGANPNTKDKNGISALMIACGYRPSSPSEKDNAEPFQPPQGLADPLKMLNTQPFRPAWGLADLPLVTLLLEHKADVKAKDRDGVTPLMVACGYARTFRKVEGTLTSVTLSSRAINLDLAKLLLEKGAPLDVKEKQGISPFLAASMQSGDQWNDALIQLLLDHKADIEVKCGIGATPLLWTANNGRLPAVQGLIAKGADIHVKSNDGKTPLIAACANGHLLVVKFLLEKGARVDVKNNRGMTPLICAAQEGRLEVVRLLLEKGADAATRDHQGKTALAHAKEKKHDAMVEVLTAAAKK